MIRPALVLALLATPALAEDSKEVSCGYQAQVVAAIQQARLDRVKERDVPEPSASNPRSGGPYLIYRAAPAPRGGAACEAGRLQSAQPQKIRKV